MRSGCSGMMQFGRELLPVRPGVTTGEGVRGWVCDTTPEHFLSMSGAASPEAGATRSAQSSWDDDGGSEKAQRL